MFTEEYYKTRFIYLTSPSRKIQNGRHEINKFITSLSKIEIETILFHQTGCQTILNLKKIPEGLENPHPPRYRRDARHA